MPCDLLFELLGTNCQRGAVKITPHPDLLLTSTAIAMTWPLAIAHVGLRFAYSRPYIIAEAERIAIPASFGVAAIAFSIMHRWRPKDEMAWFVLCAALGAILGDVWLALGEYVKENWTIVVLARSLLGGVLFAAPIGLVVGMVLGLEIIALRLWHCRLQLRGSRTMPAIAVITNVGLAGLILYGSRIIAR